MKKAAGLESRIAQIERSMARSGRTPREDESLTPPKRAAKSPGTSGGVQLSRVKEEIRKIEELLTRKITNAVEKLGTLMKKYVKE